jgi:ABC-type dipeptide/oligopeptide/nickel transport system permease component
LYGFRGFRPLLLRLPYLGYALRRLAQAIPVLAIVIVINFFLIHLAPGDPASVLAGPDASPENVAQLRVELGLDEPLPAQLAIYLERVLSFDLGFSYRFQQPVALLILDRLPATLLLMGTAISVSSFVGILLGALAARRPVGAMDGLASFLALAGYSMPAFWLGQILLLVFALQLSLFPVQGMFSLRAPSEGLGRWLDIGHHLVLPAFTYAVYHATLVFRLTRVKMIDTLAQDYILTARAKGAPERRVVTRHALPNALLPIVTVIGYNVGFMFAGSVLIETVFGWPGMGRLMFEAIAARDYPLLLGMFIVISCFVLLANIVTDLVYAVIDPRVVYR